MARRRRDADPIEDASDEVLSTPTLPVAPISFDQFRDVDSLTELEDRRRFHPEAARMRSPLSFSGLPATIGERHAPSTNRSTYPAISPPVRTIRTDEFAVVCARRRQRREVMFAKRLHKRRGRGGGRRNYWSEIKC